MKLFVRMTLASLTSGLLLVAACAGSEDPVLDDGNGKDLKEEDAGGATLPPPSNNDSGTPSAPKDAGPKDSGTPPVNTGTAPMCPALSDFGKGIVAAQILAGAGPCDQTCTGAGKCCFDILAFFAGGGSLPNVDAGAVQPGGSATGVCVDQPPF